ncbi:MAG TPA: hypothetical protein VHX68_19460 [Planctomycetaceae bacterium]|nr:hypothetical protein [Planctomycetaceae bacterium]
MLKIAYLSQGHLFLFSEGGEPIEVTSQFAREFEERQARQQQVNGWKDHSGIWGNMGFAPPQFSQWQQAAQRQRTIRFLGLDRGPSAGQLAYVLGLGPVTGLFTYETDSDRESRLFHKQDFQVGDLAQHRRLGTFAMSVSHADATKHLSVADPDGRFPTQVTAGDTVDEQPRWTHEESRRLVYQSSALVRDDNGSAIGLGPYSIQRLDLDYQAIEEILALDDHDLLQPHAAADGSLYFVRRPYAPFRRPNTIGTDLQDVVLFPFRLARALFFFLNFISMMFSGKPLRTAGGPERPGMPDTRLVMLWGQMIDTRKKMSERSKNADAGLVPRNWELVRRTADGQETVLQNGILTYDVDADGNLISTDGQRIFLQASGGPVRELTRDRFVERVVLLNNATTS